MLFTFATLNQINITMKKTFLSIFLLVATTIAFHAQQLTTYTWSHHGVSFKVPSDAKIVTNNSDIFEVDNASFNVYIEVFDGDGLSPEDIGRGVVELAREAGMKVADGEIQTWDGKGFWGISIEGERSGDQLCCAILNSTKSDLKIYVKIQYGNGYQKEANDIVNSISMSK